MLNLNLINAKKLLNDGGETFGCLLRDKYLNLVEENEEFIMYTIQARPKPESANVRKFNKSTLVLSDKTNVLDGDSGGWASVHYAIKISNDFYVLFYSSDNGLTEKNTRGIKCAIGSNWNSEFIVDNEFEIIPSGGWEGSNIEIDVGARFIKEQDGYIYYYLLYSDINYETNPRAYSGWVKIRINKNTHKVEYLSRFKNNPLIDNVTDNYYINRAGGSSNLTIDGQYLHFALSRNLWSDNAGYKFPRVISCYVSRDKLFNGVDYKINCGGIVLDELYMEKFDYYLNSNNNLVVLSESVIKNKSDSNKYNIVYREYKIENKDGYNIRESKNIYVKKDNNYYNLNMYALKNGYYNLINTLNIRHNFGVNEECNNNIIKSSNSLGFKSLNCLKGNLKALPKLTYIKKGVY